MASGLAFFTWSSRAWKSVSALENLIVSRILTPSLSRAAFMAS